MDSMTWGLLVCTVIMWFSMPRLTKTICWQHQGASRTSSIQARFRNSFSCQRPFYTPTRRSFAGLIVRSLISILTLVTTRV